MAVGIFADKAHQPTMGEVLAALGSARPLWESLTRFVADSYCVGGDFKFYGKNYGWALRYRRGGKALLSLYPGEGCVTAQIIMLEAQVEKALSLGLGPRVRNAVNDAHPYPEGRWLFVKVEAERDLNDVRQLLTVKSPPRGV